MKDSLHDSLRAVHDEEALLGALDLVRANGLAEYTYEVRLLVDDERPLRYLNLRGNDALATNVAERIPDRIQLVNR